MRQSGSMDANENVRISYDFQLLGEWCGAFKTYTCHSIALVLLQRRNQLVGIQNLTKFCLSFEECDANFIVALMM